MKIVEVAALRAMFIRRLAIGIAVVAFSGVTLVAGATGVAVAQGPDCPDVQVVFARGTGEPAGAGRVGDAFVEALRPLVPGKTVSVYAVNYPATLDFMRAADGANDASAFVQNTAVNCPDTKIVLGGYSQGAAVVDIITVAATPTLSFVNPMPPAVADHVAAVAVFGNPSIKLLGGPLTTLSPQYGYKTIDLCNGGDPVCSSGDDRPAHSHYVEAGLTTQAAQFVASRLATEAPISTLAAPTHRY
ncbi:cutinase family protein [Mycolicibacterium moriokaense]|uniref:Cutinase n=2 Tax=Mycolicibacterium moriokaense TaxID=39691 RepID=A0AAD1H9N0_9MYCO|nr:cutinase family protein [Mycolicibacterium moriokaense]ORB27198.1 cutinase family protein [Mycolicibacterium moriokaense]BBX00761.1 cutinase [Mycolicibacterium moriokaense]